MRVTYLLVLLTGCLFDHEQPPPPCQYALEQAPAEQLRDPATGQCETFGGGPPCDTQCGPCPAQVGAPAQPDWGSCFGPCESLTEQQCLATASCHATYQDDSAAAPVFWGCWDVPPSGAIQGACAGLDAQTCSEHDDCASIYTGPVNQPPGFVPSFERCASETPQAACATLTTEAACKARSDCDAIYDGSNCTCDANGCTCQTLTYSHCQ